MFEDDEIAVHVVSSSSDTLIFAFNNLATLAKGDFVWGESFLAPTGFARITFMAKRENWFPVSSMRRAADTIRKEIEKYPFRVAFGNSMGAYAAIKFADLLSVTAVLSFCPQYSIDPNIVSKFDARFTRYFKPELAGMEISSADVNCPVFIFLDPFCQEDLRHSNLIGESINVERIQVYYTGHQTVRCIAHPIRFSRLVELATKNSNPEPAMRADFIKWRRTDPYYLIALGDGLRRSGRESSAVALYRRGLAIPRLTLEYQTLIERRLK